MQWFRFRRSPDGFCLSVTRHAPACGVRAPAVLPPALRPRRQQPGSAFFRPRVVLRSGAFVTTLYAYTGRLSRRAAGLLRMLRFCALHCAVRFLPAFGSLFMLWFMRRLVVPSSPLVFGAGSTSLCFSLCSIASTLVCRCRWFIHVSACILPGAACVQRFIDGFMYLRSVLVSVRRRPSTFAAVCWYASGAGA